MVLNWLILQTLQIGLASLIITASSTTGPALALNPLITNKVNQPAVTYSVEHPTSTAKEAIYSKIVDLSTKYGLDTDTALKIAKCESDFRQFNNDGEVYRGEVNPADVGVFQINEKYHLERSESLDLDVHKTTDNIEYAMWLMKKEGTRHWNWSKPCWGKDKV